MRRRASETRPGADDGGLIATEAVGAAPTNGATDRGGRAAVRGRLPAHRAWAVGLALAVAVGGCGRSHGRAVGVAARPPITVAVAGDFPTLDPAQAADTESVSATQLMYQSLFSYNAAGQLVGLLAARWSWSSHHRRLTVWLNHRARFADGRPVTAADVAFSLDRMLREGSGAPEAASFSVLRGFAALRAGRPWQSTGIVQRGAAEIIFHLRRPAPYLPELLALPSAAVVERGVVLAAGAAADQASWWLSHSAGSGPYVLGRLIPGQSLWLDPNPHYWRRGVRVDGERVGPFAPVEFLVVSSPAEQMRLFRSGRLDVIDPLSPTQAAALGTLPQGARLLQGNLLAVSYLGFNTAKPPFDRRLARLAAAYALNKPLLLAAAGGEGELAAGLLPPGVPGYDGRLRPYPYDPALARQLLRAAGVPPGTGVTLLTIAADGTVQQPIADAVALEAARELDAVGLQVSVQAVPWATYYQDLAAGEANLFQGEWVADYPDAQDFFFNLLSRAAIGADNGTFFSDAAFDRQEAAAASTLQPALRAERFERLDAVVYARLPLLPEFYDTGAVLVQPWVHPSTLSVFLAPPLMPRLERVWLTAPPGEATR